MCTLLRKTMGNFQYSVSTNFYCITKQRGLPNTHSLIRRLCTQNSKISSSTKLTRYQFRRLVLLAKKEKFKIFGAVGCLFASSAVTMSVPFGIGKVLDSIYNNGSSDEKKAKLTKFCFLLCGVFLVALRITTDLRKDLYKAMLAQEANWFDMRSSGELISRLSNDAQLVSSSLSQNVSDGLRNTIMTMTGVGMMVYTSPQLAFFGMCAVPCLAGGAILYGKYVRKISKSLTDKYANVLKLAEEKLGNIKTVKMFGREKFELQLFSDKLMDALTLGYKETSAKAIFFGMTGLTGNVLIVSILYYGGMLVADTKMTVGTLISFVLYSAYTAISIGGLGNFYSEINKSVGAASRLWEIMDRRYAIPHSGGLNPSTKPHGNINFQNIYFHYANRENVNVLQNFNLELKSGTSTAVVGKSGSGKSTIALLLLRLYDPQKGCVTVDGIDIKSLDPHWLRKHISVVNQEPILFSGTIRDNILYGLSEGQMIEDKELWDIITDSHVDEIVLRFPDGLETLVGPRGALLSGGEKQRIAIARSYVKKPSILILDEATSALDAVSEELIQSALLKFSKEKTVLIIAHRLSTIKTASNIAVIQNGKIVELGGYEKLIQVPNGVFKDLIKNQAFAM